MGGIGSGRHDQGGKRTTSDYRSLDVRRLHRDGLLTAGHAFGRNWRCDGEVLASISIRTIADQVILTYQHRCGSSEWRRMEYPVRLEWTACTYGGARPWLICPAAGCGRRAALLYIGPAGIFACRHCYRLAYDCQRESDDDRATRRAERIRQRLGWEPGILNGPGRRPKGMHQRTFERLQTHHDTWVRTAIEGMSARLRLAEHGLGGLLEDLGVEW